MPKMIKWSGSAHEVEMLQTLQMMELAGDLPSTKILGVIPKRVEPLAFTISDELKNSVKVMEKTSLNYFKSLGFEVKKINDLTIQDIANEFDEIGKNKI